jgi:hypothetical protein
MDCVIEQPLCKSQRNYGGGYRAVMTQGDMPLQTLTLCRRARFGHTLRRHTMPLYTLRRRRCGHILPLYTLRRHRQRFRLNRKTERLAQRRLDIRSEHNVRPRARIVKDLNAGPREIIKRIRVRSIAKRLAPRLKYRFLASPARGKMCIDRFSWFSMKALLDRLKNLISFLLASRMVLL